MLRVFLVDRIPSLNKGEAAILRGLLRVLREIDEDAKLTIYSRYPEIDRSHYKSEVAVVGPGILRFSPSIVRWITIALQMIQQLLFLILHKLLGSISLKIMKNDIWRAYAEADIVLIGHDNMLGPPRFSPQYIGHIILAKGLKKKVVVCAGTIGPFEDRVSIMLSKMFLGWVDLITLRESYSERWCVSLGLDKDKIHVTGDLAFLMKPAPSDSVKVICKQEGLCEDKRPLIGITAVKGSLVFKHAFSRNRPELALDERYAQHARVFACVIDHLIETYNARIVFIPHCIGPTEDRDDRLVARSIRDLASRKDSIVSIESDYTAPELKGLIGLCDLFIGERTHSIIGSMSAGTPFISISLPDDYRTYGIVGEMAGLEDLLYDVRSLEVSSLIEAVEHCWLQRNELSALVRERSQVIERQSLELKNLLIELLESR